MKKRIVPVILLIVIVSVVVYFYKQKNVEESNIFSGTVEATEVKLSAEVMGRILEVTVDQGDKVKAEQLLVKIEHKALDAQLAQAKAAQTAASGNYGAVNATMKNIKVNLGRSENLVGVGSISQQQFDSVATQKDVLAQQRKAAYGQIKQAEATAQYIQTQIDKSTVYAPIGGVVLHKNVEPGEMAMPGTALLTLANLEKVWVRVYIPETKLGQVKIGQKAKIYSDSYPDKPYEGTVTMVDSQAEFTPKNVQTKEERIRLVYGIKVEIPNPDGELKIGMPVDAVLWE